MTVTSVIPPEQVESVREFLTEVRALLASPHSWMKYEFTNGSGGYCLVGAIGTVQRLKFGKFGTFGEWDVSDLAYHLLMSALDTRGHDRGHLEVRGEHGFNLALFNDASSTTHDDVLDLIDAALATLPERVA
jgi:hypothetical protein